MPAENFEQWFEELSRLAQEDPEAFEARRRALIEETISQAPEERQDRLRRFQWRIDMERKRAKTPLGACIKLNDMLMEMVYGEGGFLEAVNTLRGIVEGLEKGKVEQIEETLASSPVKDSARIIPFPSRK